MEIAIITIFKWIFVFAAIWLSIYQYRREVKKINLLSKQLSDNRLVRSFKADARARMLNYLIIFGAFIIWVLAYDLVNQDVNQKNAELSQELQETASTYTNLFESQKRLVSANKGQAHDVLKDTKDYYTEILTNYYVMRRCGLVGKDDIFIINSALMREIALNGIPIALRDEIFKKSKQLYAQDFANYNCSELDSGYSDIPRTYQDYIGAVREIMAATF